MGKESDSTNIYDSIITDEVHFPNSSGMNSLLVCRRYEIIRERRGGYFPVFISLAGIATATVFLSPLSFVVREVADT